MGHITAWTVEPIRPKIQELAKMCKNMFCGKRRIFTYILKEIIVKLISDFGWSEDGGGDKSSWNCEREQVATRARPCSRHVGTLSVSPVNT